MMASGTVEVTSATPITDNGKHDAKSTHAATKKNVAPCWALCWAGPVSRDGRMVRRGLYDVLVLT